MDPYTPRTITTVDALLDELGTVRRNRFAMDGQELPHDSQHVAAPIRDHTGAVVTAVSAGGRTAEMQGQFEALTQATLVGSLAISRQLGYRDPPARSAPSSKDRVSKDRASEASVL